MKTTDEIKTTATDAIRAHVQDIETDRAPFEREVRGVLDALAKKPIDDDGALVGRELMQAKVRAASRTTGATVAPAPVIDERGVVHQPPAATRGTRGRP